MKMKVLVFALGTLLVGAHLAATPAVAADTDLYTQSKMDGRRCYSALDAGRNERAADACFDAENDFADMADAVRSQPEDFAALSIAQANYMDLDSIALYRLGSKTQSKTVYLKGKVLLMALRDGHGCNACNQMARNALAQYPHWGSMPAR